MRQHDEQPEPQDRGSEQQEEREALRRFRSCGEDLHGIGRPAHMDRRADLDARKRPGLRQHGAHGLVEARRVDEQARSAPSNSTAETRPSKRFGRLPSDD